MRLYIMFLAAIVFMTGIASLHAQSSYDDNSNQRSIDNNNIRTQNSDTQLGVACRGGDAAACQQRDTRSGTGAPNRTPDRVGRPGTTMPNSAESGGFNSGVGRTGAGGATGSSVSGGNAGGGTGTGGGGR